MRKIDEIVVHCTATQPDFMSGASTAARRAEVKRWHVQLNKWSDIGYHYLIDRDGTLAEGRPLERTGAHVAGHNTGTIGIALFGGHGSAETDAFADHFTPEQDAALRKLIADLEARFGDLKISGHNEYAAKACPGFEVARWLGQGPAAKPAPGQQDEATAATRLRWRLAEIRDTAERALAGQ
ncbi:N-acetylmuramoyl-L-alanine amidase [Roseivivax isoporae]|uniref:N-acetylmuramoyl-L-alanine amidase n=1 Tax=Roseivivax isoporae LMG 25204 TaxID=1449351 RepID=X7F0T5_9RHOB|nr:N-acetylmuramoyl-L-alanine amidase [Roseivivax isoporae]ETX26497.1 hypothetical protein RISW2_23880 [Roseivivax isoporae LMG 25204]